MKTRSGRLGVPLLTSTLGFLDEQQQTAADLEQLRSSSHHHHHHHHFFLFWTAEQSQPVSSAAGSTGAFLVHFQPFPPAEPHANWPGVVFFLGRAIPVPLLAVSNKLRSTQPPRYRFQHKQGFWTTLRFCCPLFPRFGS